MSTDFVPQHAPVEPFGGTDDFDISDTQVIYTAKDPKLPPAWHTKQNVSVPNCELERPGLTPVPHRSTSWILTASLRPRSSPLASRGLRTSRYSIPQETRWHGLSSIKMATSPTGMPAFMHARCMRSTSNRAKLVLYDLKKEVRFTITQGWDRSVGSIAVCMRICVYRTSLLITQQFAHDDKTIFITAGDIARIKIFSLPVPDTPSASTTDPKLPEIYSSPREITSTGAASGVQPLSNGRLVFTRSSLTSPNDVFVLRELNESGKPKVDQLTNFAAAGLKGKSLAAGEDFFFEGAEGKKIHGWVIKPPGFKEGEKKKWPILLAIHGGAYGKS